MPPVQSQEAVHPQDFMPQNQSLLLLGPKEIGHPKFPFECLQNRGLLLCWLVTFFCCMDINDKY